MGDNEKAFKSGIAYAFASILTTGMAFITTPIFTRIMSQEDFGNYNNFLSWQSILAVIISLNLGATFISAIFDYKNDFNSYVFSMVGLCTLVIGFFFLTVNTIGIDMFQNLFNMKIEYINIMIFYIIASQLLNLFQVKEQYEFHYKKSVFMSLGISVSSVILALLLVSTKEDKFWGRVTGYTMPTIIIGCVLFFYFGKMGKKIQVKYWWYALPISIPYIPHLLSLNLLNSMDKIMIRKVWGTTETALYSLAYTCSSVVTILMNSMNTAYSPWLARNLNLKKNEKILKFSYLYISAFFFAVLGIMLVAPEVLYILGGEKYINAVYVMPPVMIGCTCQLLYTMYVNIEQFYKKTIGMAIASVCAAILNYLLNYLLVPKYGYEAAAYTTWSSYLFLLASHMFLVSRMKLGKIYDWKFTCFSVAVGIVLIALMLFLYNYLFFRYVILAGYIIIFVILAIKYGKKLIVSLKT